MMIIEKALQLFQICSQLTGTAITVSGSVYVVKGWEGNSIWERTQVRAKGEEVSLDIGDYFPKEVLGNDNLLKSEVFLRELKADREERLESWKQLPGVAMRRGAKPLSPARGESVCYQNYFKEELSEKEAREKLQAMVVPIEARLDEFTEVLLSKPRQPIYAKLDRTNEKTGIDYLGNAQNIMESLQSSALMALRTGEPVQAILKIEAMERFAGTFRGANLIGCLIEQAGENISDRLIWEGIRLRAWNDQQLVRLAELVTGREFKEGLKNALAYEASWGVGLLENPTDKLTNELLWFSGNNPSLSDLIYQWWSFQGTWGWEEHRKAYVVNYHLDLLDWLNQEATERKDLLKREAGSRLSPMWALKSSLPLANRAVESVAEEGPTKQSLVLAAIACERHFLRKKSYPENLGLLVLKIPLVDLTDPAFRDLAYKLGPQGRPVIWSRAEETREEYPKRRRLRWQFFPLEEKDE